MAHNDTPDQEIERLLQEYFAKEGEALRAPADLWQRLESRLDETPVRRRFINWLFPQDGSPKLGLPLAMAAAVVVAVVATVTVLSQSWGNGGPGIPLSPTMQPTPLAQPPLLAVRLPRPYLQLPRPPLCQPRSRQITT